MPVKRNSRSSEHFLWDFATFFFIYARVMMIDQQQKQRAHNTSSTISTTISLYIRFNAANATAAAKSDQLIASSYTQTRNIKSNSFSFLCAA